MFFHTAPHNAHGCFTLSSPPKKPIYKFTSCRYILPRRVSQVPNVLRRSMAARSPSSLTSAPSRVPEFLRKRPALENSANVREDKYVTTITFTRCIRARSHNNGTDWKLRQGRRLHACIQISTIRLEGLRREPSSASACLP